MSTSRSVSGASPPSPVASIIIAVHDQWAYTIRCLLALVENSGDVAHEVIVVDNGSSDETPRALPQLEGIRVLRNPSNLGFARACNQGAALAGGEYLVFLNNDTEPRPGWLSALMGPVRADQAVAIAGSRLLFPDETIQSAGLLLAYGFPYPLSIIPRDYRKAAGLAPPSGAVRAVTGACMLVRAAAFAAAGGFDEAFTNGYEDVDLCLRIGETGGRTLYVAESVVTHHEAVSGGRFKNEAANLDRLQGKWMERIDPAWLDHDYRRRAARAPAHQVRPAVSVVVVAQDALGTITPCIENLVRTLGPRDELVLVDDGSQGASAQVLAFLAAQQAAVTRLVSAPAGAPDGFAAAARLGIAEASRDHVALLAPNLKVGAGWLDKLTAHLERDPAMAVISPALSGRRADDDLPLYAPPDAYPAPGASVLEKLVTAGPKAVRVPASGCLVGRRAVMRELADEPGSLLGGGEPAALADRLAQTGRKLGAAGDVFVRRLNQLGGDHHGPDRARYLELQSRALSAQRTGSGGALVSVVILVRDNLRLTRECIESVYRHSPPDLELVLVDNGSSEDVAGMAADLQAARGRVVYLRNARNEGFAYACNQGIAASHGAVLVLLNNDVVVTPGWLARQLALLEMDPAIALVGPTTNATSGAQLVGTASYHGVAEAERFARRWAREHAGELAIVPRIVGLCMVMRRALVEQIGGFDTAFGFGNCEDDDFCVRVMRAGHKIAIAYDVFIHHHGSATFKALNLDARALCDENWQIFRQKWNLAPGVPAREALSALGQAAPFDPEVDRIPVDYAEIFSPQAPPLPSLASDNGKPVRILCIPDWRTPAWRAALARFFTTFTSADPVALVVRVEPPTEAGIDQAVAALSDLLRELGIAIDAAPDIVVEATVLAPARRGGLYTAVSAFLSCGGARDQFYAREARACGLPVADLAPAPAESEVAAVEAPAASAPVAPPPAVSVIVPTYNRPGLLEVALRSILAQTLQDFEIIVVNDGGVAVREVVERLNGGGGDGGGHSARGGGKIRYLENAGNRGHGASRNAALRVARGRYIAYLDDDDSFRPDHLATLVAALAGGAHQVAYSDAERARVAPAGPGAEMRVVGRDVPYSTDFDPDAILLTNFIPILCVMHERACLSDQALFDESLPVLEDWDVWIRLSRRYKFLHVPRVTCQFTVRVDGSSVTTERIDRFAATERIIRDRYAREIAASPRALQALHQSRESRRA